MACVGLLTWSTVKEVQQDLQTNWDATVLEGLEGNFSVDDDFGQCDGIQPWDDADAQSSLVGDPYGRLMASQATRSLTWTRWKRNSTLYASI
jgi:hypothetical protein